MEEANSVYGVAQCWRRFPVGQS